MGLGKTLTTLAHVMTSRSWIYPTLVVCSKTIMLEWKSNAEKFFEEGVMRVLIFHPDMMGKQQFQEFTNHDILRERYDVVVTTYDIAKSAYNRYAVGNDHRMRGESGNILRVDQRKLSEVFDSSTQRPLRLAKGKQVIYETPWFRLVASRVMEKVPAAED